jgi:hypothetical protein
MTSLVMKSLLRLFALPMKSSGDQILLKAEPRVENGLALCEAMIAEIEADLAGEDRSASTAQATSGSHQKPGG